MGIGELHGMTPCHTMTGVGGNLHDSFILHGGECELRESIFERFTNHWKPDVDRCEVESGYASYQDFHIPKNADRFTVTGYLQSWRYFPEDMRGRIRFKEEIVRR